MRRGVGSALSHGEANLRDTRQRGVENRQKNDCFKKFEDLREARAPKSIDRGG